MSILLTPRSAAVAISWPAIPAEIPARLLSLLQQFAQSERWPPERLARHQFRQLSRLVAHAFDGSAFYRARLEAAGYRHGQEITGEVWASLPTLAGATCRITAQRSFAEDFRRSTARD